MSDEIFLDNTCTDIQIRRIREQLGIMNNHIAKLESTVKNQNEKIELLEKDQYQLHMRNVDINGKTNKMEDWLEDSMDILRNRIEVMEVAIEDEK